MHESVGSVHGIDRSQPSAGVIKVFIVSLLVDLFAGLCLKAYKASKPPISASGHVI